MQLSAIDDHGGQVDWWFMYKVAGKSKTSGGATVLGTEYVYFDANMAASGKLALSPHHVDDDGALPNTLAQLYHEEGASTQHLGWYFYNDEDPITGRTNGARGHTKGVLAFDLGTNTAFWLIQSTPKFPPKGSYSFPKTGIPNAQDVPVHHAARCNCCPIDCQAAVRRPAAQRVPGLDDPHRSGRLTE